MPKLKRIYEMDAIILEALKLVTSKASDEDKKPAEADHLEKKDVGASKDVLLRMIASLKKA